MRLFVILSVMILAYAGANPALAAGDVKHPKHVKWSFDGVFGKFDRQSIQRGLQVYREVCASCHGLKRVAFRTLTDVGFSEDEVKALAAEYTFVDGPNDDGEMFDRPGRPSDKFPSPYDNENAARAVNNGAYPPDMSLLVKARHDGANYIYSLMTGYEEAPEHVQLGDGQHYNPYFPGGKLAMPEQILDGTVDYQDGTEATQEQMAKDVVAFLQWAAEPEMEDRKRMGVKVMLFLIVFTVLFYLAKKRIWARIK
ncbi:MAG: cytochrome c1 [Rickettsiales bacterium]|nr:cytochrome c1 [Rickettsiales bacterium]